MRSPDLSKMLSRSLGPLRTHADRIARLLEESCISLDALEASVRSDADRTATGGRMMITRIGPDLARSILSPIVGLPPVAEDLLRIAAREDLRLIAGWDVSSRSVAKLYLNASDASAGLRSRIRAKLGLSNGPAAPHVVGLNLSQEEPELKLYEQAETLWEDAPHALREWATTQPVSGFVRSWQMSSSGSRPKAWFVGLRGQPGPFVPTWPNADLASILEAAPFAPGAVTSVGVSPPPARWTVYFKLLGQLAPSWSLDPVGCFSDGRSEVGLYLEPASSTTRAYAQTDRWAISYRTREGEAQRDNLHRLMAWYLRVVEEHPDDPARYLHSPPEPWHVVD